MNLFDLIYHTTAAFILILGIFILANNFKQRNSQIFFLWTFSTSSWMMALYWGFWLSVNAYWNTALIVFRLAFMFSVLLMSFMTLFFYYFPKSTIRIVFPLKFAYLGFTVFLTIASLTSLILTSIVVENGVYSSDVLGPVYPLYTFNIVLNFIIGLILAIKKYMSTSGIERKKIAFAGVGYFIFVFFAILTNVILPFFGIIILFLQNLVPILTLAFVIPAFIALQKYRFFNLSYVSSSALRHMILLAIFLITSIVLMDALIFVAPNINMLITHSLAYLGGLLTFEWARKKTPLFIIGSFSEFSKGVDEFKSKMYYADAPKKLQSLLEEIFLLKLNYISAKLYIVRKKGAKLQLPVYIQNDFTRVLKRNREILIRQEIGYGNEKREAQAILTKGLNELETDICLPLFSDKNLVGFLALKKKTDGEGYSKEEIDKLVEIQENLEVVLMNLLLKTNLEEENNLMKAIIEKKTHALRHKMYESNELVRQQADFMAMTAHEFRTPLSIAIFQLDDTFQSKTKNNPELKKELTTIGESLENLKKLTQKLFEVQQYDMNKVEMKKEKVKVGEFVEDIHRSFLPIMKEKKLAFSLKNDVKKSLTVVFDPSQMRQVVHNLLTNAYKFTPEGQITLEVAETKDNLLIKVTDSGQGIPKGMRKAVFKKFRSGHTGGGIGLGLYICQKIVELHGGKIWNEDAPGEQGTVFIIQMPK